MDTNTTMKVRARFGGVVLLPAVLVAAFAPVAHADEEKPASPWSGNAALGFIASGGNTESSSYNAEYAAKYAGVRWTYSSAGKLNQQRSQVEVAQPDGAVVEEKQTTAETYQTNLRAERRVDDENYLFGQAAFLKDLFGAVRTRTSQTIGYGRRVIKTESTSLDLEIGAGARQEEQQATRENVSEGVGQLGLSFATRFNERSSFAQQVTVQYGEENTVTDSQTRLKLSVVGAIWAQLGFDLRHNSETGPGEKSTDTITSISLLWDFGG